MKKYRILLLALGSLLLGSQWAKADDFDLYLVSDELGYTALDYANLRSLSFSQVREDLDGDGTRSYENYVTANYNDGSAQTFNLSAYRALVFESTAVGISPLDSGRTATLAFDGHSLRAEHAGLLRIYQPDGRLVGSQHVEAGQVAPLPQLATGTYIVNFGGQSAKILVK